MVAPLRLVFFGTPAFAVPSLRRVLDSGHTVVGVVTQPDRPRGRGHHVSAAPVKELALERGLPVLQPERLKDAAFLEQLAAWKPDLGLVAAYGRILPDAVLQLPRLGLINVHASLLPKYRGAAPVHRAVIAGERETGVTIMRVVKELDAGPMLDIATRPIADDETSAEVEAALAELGAARLVEAIDRIAAGTQLELAQDDRDATYAHRIARGDGLIDWSAAAQDIHNRVRGLHPWPHAFTFLGSVRVLIRRTRVIPASDAGASVQPGRIETTRDTLHVAAGDGRLLEIVELQLEGRRPMTAREFLAGHSFPADSRFQADAAP